MIDNECEYCIYTQEILKHQIFRIIKSIKASLLEMDIRKFFVKTPHGSDIIASSSDIAFKESTGSNLTLALSFFD